MKKGIDVSYYQPGFDFVKAKKSGIDFCMVKATQHNYPDPLFNTNINNAYNAGLRVGVYHYLCATSPQEALAEAYAFLKYIKPYKDKITMYCALDVEDEVLPRDRKLLTDMVNAFLTVVESSGDFIPCLYTNPDFLRNRLADVSRWNLWLALWRDKSIVPATKDYPGLKLWQWGLSKVSGTMVDSDFEVVEGELPMTENEKKRFNELAEELAELKKANDERLSKLEEKDSDFGKQIGVSINWDAHLKQAKLGDDAITAIHWWKKSGFNGTDKSHYGLSRIEARLMILIYRALKSLGLIKEQE